MRKIYAQNTTLRVILGSIVVILLGAVFIYISYLDLGMSEVTKSILREIGNLFFVTVAVTLIWELIVKRSFLDEVLSASELVEEIRNTGLLKLSSKSRGEIDWDKLFNQSSNIQIFFMYGRTWRHNNRENLKSFAERKGTSAIIILPDYEDEQLLNRLSLEINISPADLKNLIIDSEKDFIKIFHNDTKLSIWLTSIFPVYSMYKFDSNVIVTFYSLSREKVEVPTFLFGLNKSIPNFFIREFDSLIKGDSPPSKRVFPQDPRKV